MDGFERTARAVTEAVMRVRDFEQLIELVGKWDALQIVLAICHHNQEALCEMTKCSDSKITPSPEDSSKTKSISLVPRRASLPNCSTAL
jgi:hypothetical protein